MAHDPATAPALPTHPAYAATLDCVHCGLCTQHCPTYRVTGEEGKNPRGRIYLMRALHEGRATATPDLVEDLDTCLVCRACEAVCPSGVRFGELMADARSRLRKPGRFRRYLLRDVVPNRARLARLARILRFVQFARLDVLRFLLPARMRRLAAGAPRVPPAGERRPLPRKAAALGERRGSVLMFEGCVMPVLFQDVNRATIQLVRHAGYDVAVPESQTCCGALHEHDGDLDFARTLAAANAEAFADPRPDAVIMNSAGCGAALKGYGHLLGTAEGAALAAKSVDWSRFLADRGAALRFVAEDDSRPTIVAYDAPCHLLHAQGEATAPLELLRRVPGVEIRKMELADLCCGAAGLFSADQPEMSAAVLAPKLDALEKTGAEVLLTGNPGCLLQWRQGIASRGLNIRVEHPAAFLAARLA